jgi:hypothetical protein
VVAALEAAWWGLLRFLGVEKHVEVFLLGSVALISIVCAFGPASWLAHSDIAGPAAKYPIIVRGILILGGAVLWVLTYLLATS